MAYWPDIKYLLNQHWPAAIQMSTEYLLIYNLVFKQKAYQMPFTFDIFASSSTGPWKARNESVK